MNPSISKELRYAGQELVDASGSSIASVLNQILNRFLGWPFKAATGSAVDSQGQRTETFDTLVYTTSSNESVPRPVEVPADVLACVIDVSETMDLARFRAAYERISWAKKLRKAAAPYTKDIPHTTMTLGIIFATKASVSVEVLAEELNRLNGQTPSAQWPDMVVVLSKGTINYAVQFPGETTIGDFLPPAEGALASYIPPIYIVAVMTPTREYTLNKMCAFLIAHLAIFSPGANLPNFAEVLE